jgi:hypothetical protein
MRKKIGHRPIKEPEVVMPNEIIKKIQERKSLLEIVHNQ